MLAVLRGLGHPLGVAGEAGLISLGVVFKAVAAAGGVALDAVQLARFDAGAQEPGG